MFIVDMHRDIIFKLGIALSILVHQSIESKLNYVSDTIDSKNGSRHDAGEAPVFYQGVEGTPGVDFPIFSHIPRTVFSCKGLESGYYADLDTDCQVFHICEEEKKISFLCPNGTIFQQADLICEWWFKVDCGNSPNLFEESVEHLKNDESRRKSFRRVTSSMADINHGAVMRTEASSISVKNIEEHYDANKSQRGRTRKNPPSSNHGIRNVYLLGNNEPEKTVLDENEDFYSSTSRVVDSLSRSNVPKFRRYNDDQTGNYLNNLHESGKINYHNNSKSTRSKSRDIPKTTKMSQFQELAKEYHVQFPLSSTGTDSTTVTYDNDKYSNNEDTGRLKSTRESSYSGKNHDSDETIVTRESSSFVRNAYNSIQDDKVRFSTVNPYPNHRTTYSDLKTPNLSSSKVFNAISSVTPQYITTQPLNNGKPFFGSRVGINITTRDPIFTPPIIVGDDLDESRGQKNEAPEHSDLIQASVGNGDKNASDTQGVANLVSAEHSASASGFSTAESTTETKNPLLGSPFSTVAIQTGTPDEVSGTPRLSENLEPSPTSHTAYKNRNVGLEAISANLPLQLLDSFKATAGATPAEVFPSKQPTQSSPNDLPTVNQSKKQSLIVSHLESTPKTVDYATVYGSFVRTNPTTPIPPKFGNAIQIKFDRNADKVGVHLSKSITGAGPKPVLDNVVTVLSANSNADYGNVVHSLPRSNPLQDIESLGGFKSAHELKKDQSRTANDPAIDIPDYHEAVPVSRSAPNTDSFTTPSYSEPHTTAQPTLYVVLRNATQKPRPFGKSQQPTSFASVEPNASSHSYKISTASPFKSAATPDPTLPTPFTTARPPIPESVGDMINILKEISKFERDYPSETPRPGLVIPPSVGPQTLHTLAVYFENALDQIAANKAGSPQDTDNEVDKEKLTHLLTEMTQFGYNQLFDGKPENGNLTTEPSGTTADEDSDLGGQSSKNIVQGSEIRELAKNFTVALSSFLNDPDMFRKDLEDLRPTEPPLKSHEEGETGSESIRVADEELLNFSDSDSKLSLPAVFSTTPPPSPTWAFILATKATNDIDVDNSLNPDLNTADSQSFVPSYNSLNAEKNFEPSTFPQNHWTTSPSATKLWRNTFSINPAIVNDNLDAPVTVTASDDTEPKEEFPRLDNSQEDDGSSEEIKYELRTLPKLTLNSTEVHGLLVEFMNTTNKDSDVLYSLLKKLNITEDEFLRKMRDIESNPLTRRLILLLISECGIEATRQADFHGHQRPLEQPVIDDNPIKRLVDPTLTKENEDTRALQLLNALYSIASKFSK